MFKDAKLFGKINIIDLFIVIGIIGVAVFGVQQFRGGEGIIAFAPETREFLISFYTEEVENFTANALRLGDNVFDNGPNLFLGVVEYLDIGDAVIWNADQYGNTVRSNKEGFSSVEITARLTAVPHEHGIMIAGNRYGIGHSLAVRSGASIIFMRVSGLEEIN
ncbi:MAG: DUF4330 domain-containing protein [Defluviitaleaceae bacterium]|nr:DUF4330 domain-containing protein [Defluviitaleaceae bacterium]MCL2261819.1 DUF4330 domain-containing protein [Defluviitaleaceae bacterium]